MVLVDSSVWIEFFRKTRPLDLAKHVDFDEIVTCFPVMQEVLAGIRDEGAFSHIRTALGAAHLVDSPLEEQRVLEAIDVYRAARRRGITPRSQTDCLIAAIALANDLEVLHRDRDFEALARVVPLRQRNI